MPPSRQMFDTPALPRIETLLQEVRDGLIQIPAVQRGFVWGDDRRLKLMDSVEKGLPIGSLLVWRTKKRLDLQAEARLGPYLLPKPTDGELRNYLLDGLQRVTTLYAALHGEDRLAKELDEDNVRWPIYYDLEPAKSSKDDLRFHLRHVNRAVPLTWLPMNIVFDYDAVLSFVDVLKKAGKGTLVREAQRVINRFRDYVIPVVPLVTDDLAVAATSFARINSQAKKIGEPDLLRALTLGQENGFDLTEQFAKIKAQLAPLGWGDLEAPWLLNSFKVLSGLDVYRASPTAVRDLLVKSQKSTTPTGHDISLEQLTKAWKLAAELLRSFGVRGPASAPYEYQVLALVKAAHIYGQLLLDKHQTRLEQWFFDLAYRESFTGMTGSEVTQACEDLLEMLRTGGNPATEVETSAKVSALEKIGTNSVRTQLFLLVTARAADESVENLGETAGGELRTALLGVEGAICVRTIFPDVSATDPANRVIATPDELQRLRTAIEYPLLPSLGRADRARMHVSTISMEHLRQKGVAGFCEQRRAELEALEESFVQRMGFIWARR